MVLLARRRLISTRDGRAIVLGRARRRKRRGGVAEDGLRAAPAPGRAGAFGRGPTTSAGSESLVLAGHLRRARIAVGEEGLSPDRRRAVTATAARPAVRSTRLA